MMYVKAIEHSSEGRLVFDWKNCVSVVVNEDGVDSTVSVTELLGKDCIGFSPEAMRPSCPGVVCHDKKSAQLFRYIESVKTVCGVVTTDINDIDLCVLGTLNSRVAGDGTGWAVAIDSCNEFVYTSGYNGSVVTVESDTGDIITVCSLFDLLSSICTRLGVNIMLYKQIKLYRQWDYCTTIDLVHNPEADRFFMKMFFSGR